MEWRVLIIWWTIFGIRYSILRWIYFKKHGLKIDNPSIRTYVSKIESRIKFRIKTRYYPELFTAETIRKP